MEKIIGTLPIGRVELTVFVVAMAIAFVSVVDFLLYNKII
jgi:hypothetical protein